uniref:Uncharacterized protein n=1 Tax=Brassica campestris TaxID=3711 RepID=M4DZM1_BRACM
MASVFLFGHKGLSCNFTRLLGVFSRGYFWFWAIVAIAWGTIGSIVIVGLPLIESWGTIKSVCMGLFTNDRLMDKLDDLNHRLRALTMAVPEAERIYLLELEKTKKTDEERSI